MIVWGPRREDWSVNPRVNGMKWREKKKKSAAPSISIYQFWSVYGQISGSFDWEHSVAAGRRPSTVPRSLPIGFMNGRYNTWTNGIH